MSDAQKTHTIQLGKGAAHEVSAHDLPTIEKATGRGFSSYVVKPLPVQPTKPADVATAPAHKHKAAEAIAKD